MAPRLDPNDVPLPGLPRDPGLRPAAAPERVPQVVDPMGQALASAGNDLASANRAAAAATERYKADLDSISATFKELADKRQAAENAAFVDRFQLEYSKRVGTIQSEALNSPDVTKPDFIEKLDTRLADAQAEVMKQLREQYNFSPNDDGVNMATRSAMDVRTATARTTGVVAHNQRLGMLVNSTSDNLLQIGRDAASTGDLEDGINRTNTVVNSLRGVLAPDKFETLKSTARQQTTEMVVRGYIERGEYDRARAVLDQNRAFVGIDQTVADVARRSGVDPTLVVAFGRAESSGNPAARPGINPRTGQPYSRASGLFQFIPSTARAYGLPDDAASASVEEQTRAATAKIKDDTRILKRELGGGEPTAGQLYLAWVLGPETAAKVLKAPSSTPISQVVDQKAIAANPSVLAGKTVGDVADWAAVKMVVSGAGRVVPGAKFVDNMAGADKALGLSPEEQALYQRHLTNLYGPGGVSNADGSRSTLFAATIEQDGKTYLIPTVWGGKILSADEATERARKEGLDKFPSYASDAEAQQRYSAMHAFMDKDAAAYFATRRAQANNDLGRMIKEDTRVSLLNLMETQQRQSEERNIKLVDRQLKLVGEQHLREIYRRAEGLSIDQATNQPIPLTTAYVDSVRQYLSPTEYRGALALTRGGSAEDAPAAIVDLTSRIDTADPETFMKAAVAHLEANRLKSTTFTSLVEKNRAARKDDQPASPYKVGKTYVEQALDPGFLSGPAAQPARMARANAIVEYENWVQANPNATRADALNAAANISSRYLTINTNEIKMSLGRSPYFGQKASNAIRIEDVDAAEKSLYADMKAKRLTREQAEVEIRRLNNWRAVLGRSAPPPVPKPGTAAPNPRTPLLPSGDL